MRKKLNEEDVKYFKALNSTSLELEQKIASLEIEKFGILYSYYELREKYNEFSKQIRAKYDIQHPDAEIDLDEGVIIIPDDIDVFNGPHETNDDHDDE